jgi:8-oxo-dGTP pyrophosphatase MutT (NUDIX family)
LTSPSAEDQSDGPAAGATTERAAGFVLFRTSPSGTLEYLLLRHRDGGHWGFPKGRLEAGESELEAALRETREETALEDLDVLDGVCHQTRYRLLREGSGLLKTVSYFAARVATGEGEVSDEHEAMTWLPYLEARATLSYEEPRAVLDAVAQATGDPSAGKVRSRIG